jgi:hypothetical protein
MEVSKVMLPRAAAVQGGRTESAQRGSTQQRFSLGLCGELVFNADHPKSTPQDRADHHNCRKPSLKEPRSLSLWPTSRTRKAAAQAFYSYTLDTRLSGFRRPELQIRDRIPYKRIQK